ncbi:MAG TPA: DinB family protein [Gemmatimonadaceae bacterium]
MIVSTLAVSILPSLAVAQAAPVAQAFRDVAATDAKNLVAAAEKMPADKYAFKPTPAQMTFAGIVVHLSGGNDQLCGAIGNMKPPTRTPITEAAGKDALVARLKETFDFCQQALAHLDDSGLTAPITMFGQTMTRAGFEMETVGDWSDHYSQAAVYLRLNGELPPTAKPPKPAAKKPGT